MEQTGSMEVRYMMIYINAGSIKTAGFAPELCCCWLSGSKFEEVKNIYT